VVRAASGATAPTVTDGPAAAKPVGRKPGNPAGLDLAPDDGKLLLALEKGLSPKKISMRLGVAESEVRARIDRLCAQLGAAGPLEVAPAARTLGLLPTETGADGREA
jgi:DNA-binding NarL/FixJ family response regulator